MEYVSFVIYFISSPRAFLRSFRHVTRFQKLIKNKTNPSTIIKVSIQSLFHTSKNRPIYVPFPSSASNGALGGVSFNCTPPLFLCPESEKGNFQPPSFSGVASHKRMRCLLGVGGA
jgi:hypothetical protein